MTIIQLEYLLAIVNYGSFSTASEKCFVTQPSLSMQIKNLEEELGVTLLDRAKKPIVLTEMGEHVVKYAREAISSFNAVRECVIDAKGEVRGQVRFGIVPTVAPYMLQKFIPILNKNYPDIDLQIKETTSEDIVFGLNHDLIDVAITTGLSDKTQAHEEVLFEDKFWAYVSPRHKLYKKDNINVADIDMSTLVMPAPEHCFRNQILQLCCARNNMPSGIKYEGGTIETMMQLADITHGITIVPEMVKEFISPNRRSRIRSFCNGTTSRQVVLNVRRGYVKSSVIAAIKESISESGKDLIFI